MSSEHLGEAQMKIETTLLWFASLCNEYKLSLKAWIVHRGSILHPLSKVTKDCTTARMGMNPNSKVARTFGEGGGENFNELRISVGSSFNHQVSPKMKNIHAYNN